MLTVLLSSLLHQLPLVLHDCSCCFSSIWREAWCAYVLLIKYYVIANIIQLLMRSIESHVHFYITKYSEPTRDINVLFSPWGPLCSYLKLCNIKCFQLPWYQHTKIGSLMLYNTKSQLYRGCSINLPLTMRLGIWHLFLHSLWLLLSFNIILSSHLLNALYLCSFFNTPHFTFLLFFLPFLFISIFYLLIYVHCQCVLTLP